MKIELQNVKSVGTSDGHCFSATLLLDGDKVGTVSNGGFGGPNEIAPAEAYRRVADYAKTMPRMPWPAGIGIPVTGDPLKDTFQPTADFLVGKAFGDWMEEDDLRKKLRKRLLFTKPGETSVFESKVLPGADIEAIVAMSERERAKAMGGAIGVLLNALPFEEAMKLWRGEPAPAEPAAALAKPAGRRGPRR